MIHYHTCENAQFGIPFSAAITTVGQREKVNAVTFFSLRPRAAKFPWMKSRDLLVYRMYVTRSQFSANTGILVCLVREIWQFKVFTGKEVTPLHEKGNS